MSFLLGTFTGIVAGGLFGLAKTPRSGKANQAYIKSYINELESSSQAVKNDATHLKDTLNRLQDELAYVQGSLKDSLMDTLHNFKHEATPRLKSIQRHQDKLVHDIQALTDDIEQSH